MHIEGSVFSPYPGLASSSNKNRAGPLGSLLFFSSSVCVWWFKPFLDLKFYPNRVISKSVVPPIFNDL